MQWNCNSPRSKIPLIKDYIIREKINILALSEAKRSDEEARDILRLIRAIKDVQTKVGVTALIIDKIQIVWKFKIFQKTSKF
jgi:hypothetical protein